MRIVNQWAKCIYLSDGIIITEDAVEYDGFIAMCEF